MHLWVKKMEGKKNSPVIFYKQQGETFADIAGINQGLNKDDFALVIQTPIQAEVRVGQLGSAQ